MILCRLNRAGAAGKFAAGEHNAPLTALADETNIRAQTGDDPVRTSAGMRLAHVDLIADL